MGLPDIENIPETGAVFTIGRSRFAENVASHFFIRKDPVVSVTCGDEHSAVVCESGRLFVFGSNDWGQLGLGHKNHVSKPSCVKVLKPEKVTHVACGRAHTLICTTDQKIFACGSDQESQLGRGSLAVGDSSSSPVMIHDCGLAGPKLLQIAAGSHHSLALTSDGGVLAWGSNLEGQLGLPGTSGLVNTPTKVHIPEPVKQISAGYYHSAFLTESGKIYVCGEAESGKLGIVVDFRTQVAPKQMELAAPAALVACGGHHTLILDEDGKVHCTGSNASGQLGMGTDVTEISTPELLPCDILQGEIISKIGCGESHIAIVTDSGNLYTCGDCRHGKLGLEENDNNIHELTLAVRYQELVVTDISCGGCHTILVGRRRHVDNKADDKHHQDHSIQQTKNSLPPLKMPAPRALDDNTVNEKPKEVPPDAENNTDEMSHEATVEISGNDLNGPSDSINRIDKPEIPKQFSDYEKVLPKAPSNLDDVNEDGDAGHENNNGEAADPILDAENNISEEAGESETAKSPRSSGSGVSRVVVEERKKSAGGRVEVEESVEKPDSTPLQVEPPPKPPRQKISSAENSQSSRQGSSSSRLTSASSGKKKNDNGEAENLTGNAPEPENWNGGTEEKEGEQNKNEEKKEVRIENEEKEEEKIENEGKCEDPKNSEGKDETDEQRAKEREDEKVKKKEADPELPVDSEETADVGEEKTKSDGESTKRSAGSEKSRSAKSKAGTDETVEADIQNGLDDIEDHNIPLDTKKEIVAEVVHSSAPRTVGKMSKLFKNKKQEVENGTKANGTSTKAKSKTCTML